MQSVLLLLSFLLLSHGGAAGASDVVVDVNGDEVKAEQLYYVLPAPNGVGGLRLESLEKPCPLYVYADVYKPEPLAFFPENPTEDIVREGDTLLIKFFRPTICPQSTVWNYDVDTGLVGTGGTMTPALDRLYSQFAIFKSEEPHGLYNATYHFRPCPYGVGVECLASLGLDNFESHHVLSRSGNNVLDVVFSKVQEGALGSKIRPVASRAKA